MRFIMMIKANAQTEAGVMPTREEIDRMMNYNEKLANSGIMLSGDGLHPSSKGARLNYKGGKTIVTDGPFSEAKELIAGYWIIQTRSKAEAVEWAKRIPLVEGDEIELRQIFEISDFAPETVDMGQYERVASSLTKG